MNIKKTKLTLLPIMVLMLGCNSPRITDTTATSSSKPTSSTTVASLSNVKLTNSTDILPDSTDNGSLQDKYNINTYIQTNKILESIPYSQVDTYKVNFTSDGGAIFAIKSATDNNTLWKKTTKKLLFDTFQLLNVTGSSDDTKYYSRYSQLIESNINVTLPDGNIFDNTANLVQTVGLSMKKITNGYQISGLTPVTVRQIDKNNLKYKIDKISLDYGDLNLTINADKTLIPWPGISLNGTKKASLKVFITSKEEANNPLEVLIGIGKDQFQLKRNSDMSFSGDFNFPDPQNSKISLVIELIDQNSLTKNAKYGGYTWIIPFVS